MINNKKAFTLAEVLITLGIIGVVAALTIPTLMQKTEEKQTVSQLKKVYSTFSNAFGLAVEANGTPDTWGMTTKEDANSHIIMATNMKSHLNLLADCVGMNNTDTLKKCGNYNVSDIGYARIILSDGTYVAFRNWSGDCSWNDFGDSEQLKNVCGEINVDLNGDKKPNTRGKDQFHFLFTKYGIIPWGVASQTKMTFSTHCNRNTFGQVQDGVVGGTGCAAWVIYNENMDYLHCDGLSWGGKTKCD